MNTIRIATIALAIGAPLSALADSTTPATPAVNTAAVPANATTATTKLAPGKNAVGGKSATLQTSANANGDDRSQSIGTGILPPKPPKKEALEAAQQGAAAKAAAAKAKAAGQAAQH